MEKKFENLEDEQLLRLIQKGNEDAQDFLLNKYKKFVKIKARTYFLMGADKEDLIQEGMIGLYKAIKGFNPNKFVHFYSFAELCITRQIITAIKAASRQKHLPLNSYISLNRFVSDETKESTYMDLLKEKFSTGPEELLISREEKLYIEKYMLEILSKMECNVLSFYLQGKSYSEIAKIISKDEKSIDNALQRVRKKVDKILLERNLTPQKKYAKI